jgi:Flp pilus assembly protein TadD
MPPNHPSVPPSVGEAKFNEAVALHRAGRLDEAAVLYHYVAKHFPSQPDPWRLLGLIGLQTGDAKVALDHFDKAIKADPADGRLRYDRGRALKAQNRLEAALAAYDKAVLLTPSLAEAWAERGAVLLTLGQPEGAEASYARALALAPEWAEAWSNRAAALRRLDRFEDALAAQERALALNPTPEARHNRSIALLDLDRAQEALADAQAALSARPDFADAWINHGATLRRLGRLPEALASQDRALALAPRSDEAHYNRALALQDLKRLDESVAALDQAIFLNPAAIDPPMTRAVSLLMNGDFAQGWPAYEARWKRPGLRRIVRRWARPQWTGAQSLEGRTLLVHAEQGLGDTIHFCRYAALAARRGARVILEVQPPLVGLMRTLEGPAQVIARGDPLPAFDLQAPLLSLPLAFGTAPETIPADIPYLQADPAKSADWAQRLGPEAGPRVGLVWRGNPDQENDRNRSLPLAVMAAHLPQGLDYVSLQQDLADADRPALHAAGIRHFGADLLDFADTAALTQQMDVVVSVCTAGAHLAGALGKDVRILLANQGVCWRWLTERRDSPWYPTATLYRQDVSNDWASVLNTLARDLAQIS